MPRRPPPSDGRAATADELRKDRRRLDVLEQPDGNQLGRALEKVQQLTDDLPGLITAYLASGFSTGSVTLSGYVFTPAGYAFDITYTRRGAWLGNDGRLGWASSSITAKELLDTIPEPDALVIMEITSHHYQRKVELAKRDDPKSEQYVGPEYLVGTEWGAIAEELHSLGLWQVVVYEWDTVWDLVDVLDDDDQPILNEQGHHLKERVPGSERRVEGAEPRPVGVHYELLGLLAIVAVRHVWQAHSDLATELRGEVAAIKKQLGA